MNKKVSYTYQYLSRTETSKIDKYIQNACKYVLTTSMNRTDGYRYDEVGVLIDLNGNILCTLYGKNGHIDSNNDIYLDYAYCGADRSTIFIHNHPNNSKLSYNDIDEEVYKKLKETAEELGLI